MKKFILALALMALAASGLAAEEPSVKDLPSSQNSEILLIGKFFCSIKRQVPLPFKGTVTSVRVQAGQMVEKGEVLATYHLSSEARLQISRSLVSSKGKDYETKLAEVQNKLKELVARKKREFLLLLAQQQLAKQHLLQQHLAKQHSAQQQFASPLSLTNTDREVKTLTEQLEIMENEKQVAQEALGLLRSQVGTSLNPGQIAAEAYVRAPISGYIIWIHPNLHIDVELDPTKSVLQIGVMDPMLLRSRVFESEAMQLTLGDEAEVIVPSIPGRKFKAHVSRVAWAPTEVTMNEPTYYDIEFSVANPDLLLKEGLKCTITMRKPT